MSNQEQYFNNLENNGVDPVVSFDTDVSHETTSEFSGPTSYPEDVNVKFNGEPIPPEAFNFSPETATEWELLTPEKKVESVELARDVVLLASLPEIGAEKAERAAKVSSLGTAFALANTPEEDNLINIDDTSPKETSFF